MKELGLINRLPRIACAQAERANPLFLSYQTGFSDYKPVAASENPGQRDSNWRPGQL